MRAKEARELSIKKATTIEQVIESIRGLAVNGERQCSIIVYLSTDVITELLALGYSIRTNEDPFSGMKNTIIEW